MKANPKHTDPFPIAKAAVMVGVMLLPSLAALGAGSQKKAESRGADPAIVPYNQGIDLMLAKQYAAAEQKFEQAIKVRPKFAEAHNNLAYTLRKQGPEHYQEALEQYNTAIRLNSNLAEAYMYRGILYAQTNRKADAQADWVKLQKLNPKLAKELEEVLTTGKEGDRVYGLAKRVNG
jgi:tetratricopeptide (TPR) repeat protein